MVRFEHDGSNTVLVDRHHGKRLNSPNDVVVTSDGAVWFTDPTYGILSDYEGEQGRAEQAGCYVYRVDPFTGAVEAKIKSISQTQRARLLARREHALCRRQRLLARHAGPTMCSPFDVG